VLNLDQELLDGIRQIIREEISGVEGDVSSLKEDVSSLKTDVSSLKTDVSTLKSDVAEMKPQLEENTDMVRVLLANSKTHGAEIEQLNHRVAGLEGNKKRVDKLEKIFLNHRHEVVFEIGESVFDD